MNSKRRGRRRLKKEEKQEEGSHSITSACQSWSGRSSRSPRLKRHRKEGTNERKKGKKGSEGERERKREREREGAIKIEAERNIFHRSWPLRSRTPATPFNGPLRVLLLSVESLLKPGKNPVIREASADMAHEKKNLHHKARLGTNRYN